MSQFMSRVVAILGVAVLTPCVSAQLFTDGLSNGNAWTITQDADSSFVFGFDYSTKGVPAAPNGSDTVGLEFEVNNNDSQTGVASITAVHTDAAFTGQFTFSVDVWLNWAPDGGLAGSGTTEFAGASVGHDGITPRSVGRVVHLLQRRRLR